MSEKGDMPAICDNSEKHVNGNGTSILEIPSVSEHGIRWEYS